MSTASVFTSLSAPVRARALEVFFRRCLFDDASRPFTPQMVQRFEQLYQSGIHPDNPLEPIDCPSHDKYDFLRYVTINKPVVLHGSLVSVSVLEPRERISEQGFPEYNTYATTSVGRVIQHTLYKRAKNQYVGCRRPVLGASYVLASDLARSYSFISLNRALLDKPLDPGTVYICSRDAFTKMAFADDGTLAAATNGKVNGALKWIATEPVSPMGVVSLALKDLLCGVSWHTENESMARVMWSFKKRARSRPLNATIEG